MTSAVNQASFSVSLSDVWLANRTVAHQADGGLNDVIISQTRRKYNQTPQENLSPPSQQPPALGENTIIKCENILAPHAASPCSEWPEAKLQRYISKANYSLIARSSDKPLIATKEMIN